jgi:hypothetical protein
VDTAIHRWEQLATQIIIIVGEEGFNSLYARSLFLSQAQFPWISNSALTPNAPHRFEALKTSLEGQSPAQAGEAAHLLLITFTDILASLIGDQLTTLILGVAWDIDTRIELARDSKNE